MNGNLKQKKAKARALAREMYMVPKKDGKNEHSLAKIVSTINKKFGLHYTRKSMENWAKKPDANGISWRSQYKASVSLGLSKEKIDEACKEEGKDPAEAFEDALASSIHEIAQKNRKINNFATNWLLVWQSSCQLKLEELSKEVGGLDKISKDSLDEAFDKDDKNLMLVLKKDTDAILESLRNSGVDSANNVRPQVSVKFV